MGRMPGNGYDPRLGRVLILRVTAFAPSPNPVPAVRLYQPDNIPKLHCTPLI
jgi:hypothetical protein